MNDVEVKRLAHAINELRPSWPISSLTTFISRSLSNRPYRDAAIALVWVALDSDGAGNYVTETPRRVLELGPWWKAAEASGALDGHRAHPPKRHETCRKPGHEGYRADNCAGCAADRLAETDPPTQPTTKSAALAECRAALSPKEGASDG